MENLEQTVEKSFLGKVKNNLRRVRDSVAGKVMVYSLVGVLSASLGYGCGGDKAIAPEKDALETYETEVYQNDSKQDAPEKDAETGEVNTGIVCWDKTFGGSDDDFTYSIQQTKDGGYITAGYTESKGAGLRDAWIIKLDSDGNVEWDKTFGGSDYDVANSIQQTNDGGYIVAGYTNSKGAGLGDAWVLKLDENGELEWDKTFGGSDWDEAYSIQQTADLGYIVGGYTKSKGAGYDDDAWVFKLKPNGELEWDKTFGGSYYDEAYSIQQTKDLGYIVAGYTSGDAWVLKLAQNGNLEWDKTYGGSDFEEAYSIQQTSDGGYIAAGWTNSKGEGKDDAWILKLEPNGELEWDKTFGGESNDWAKSIQQTKDGGYIVAGWTWSKGAGDADAWILKLAQDGNLEWDKTYGGSDFEEAYSIQQTKDSGYIVAAYTESKGAGGSDAWVLKLDKDGNLCK